MALARGEVAWESAMGDQQTHPPPEEYLSPSFLYAGIQVGFAPDEGKGLLSPNPEPSPPALPQTSKARDAAS